VETASGLRQCPLGGGPFSTKIGIFGVCPNGAVAV